MDIARTFNYLRPGAKFIGDEVNYFDLVTISKTFIGIVPTQIEMDIAWKNIQAADIEVARVTSIQTEARNRIIALVTEWTTENHEEKQRNALMKSSQLLRKELVGTISVTDKAELDNLEVLSAQIEAIRDTSNLAEADGTALADIIWP